MCESDEELLKKIWKYKSLVDYDLSHPDEESKSALYMEDILKDLGISPKKNLGYQFFLGIRVLTDVQLGYIHPIKAVLRLKVIHY
jgi:hypothetical protein